jgi:hypothetical protein
MGGMMYFLPAILSICVVIYIIMLMRRIVIAVEKISNKLEESDRLKK